MTKKELKQEAENKLDEWSDPDMGCEEGYCYSEVADFMFKFAEPREMRIKELEAALAEQKQYTEFKCFMFGKKSEEYEHQIAVLKKEKEELIADMAKAIPLLEKSKVISESLTKAKEIIRKMIEDVKGYDFLNKLNDIQEAEDFIKDV